WQKHIRDEVFQMAIHATIVPEPATGWLLGVGLLSLSLCRHRLTLFLTFSRSFRRISDFKAPF
ncbi:MAG TPA: PEP-CTERM sorting domain-containing protein, partial [Kiritimatiellia bacterium]|nr:PEP-CTERM sorting domain-containing protein [Kiritimatiellia bacterium]